MDYRFILTKKAVADLKQMEPTIARRLVKKLQWYAAQAEPWHYAKRLEHSQIGDVRWRVGDYRIIGVVDRGKKLVVIEALGHRREVYKERKTLAVKSFIK